MNKNRNIGLYILIGAIYIVLPLLITFNVLSFDYKFIFLTLGGILVYTILRFMGFNNIDMGITLKNTHLSLLRIIPITTFLLLLGIFIYINGGINRFQPNESLYFYIFYIFISSPIQEFLYRGALISVLDRMNIQSYKICIITSLLYSFVHIIYRDILTLILTFLIGIIWYRCYIKNKNLIGVCVSHAVLGIITIITGIID